MVSPVLASSCWVRGSNALFRSRLTSEVGGGAGVCDVPVDAPGPVVAVVAGCLLVTGTWLGPVLAGSVFPFSEGVVVAGVTDGTGGAVVFIACGPCGGYPRITGPA